VGDPVVSGVFDAYAAYYDLLYRDKDYAGEARYVEALLAAQRPGQLRVLELGCGTGGHAAQFAAHGHAVTGVDRSEAMLGRARARLAQAAAAAPARFVAGDLRTYRDGERYDAVVALFHVVSYQTSDADLAAAMATAAAHLEPGGVFVFDCWHGPGVLADPPSRRVREFEGDGVRVVRTAEPTHLAAEHVVLVDFAIEVESAAGTRRIDERHAMRYLFVDEVERLLADAGLERVASTAWLERRAPTDADWYACHLARRPGPAA
jgi:SAM-dependent methyltransferase